MKATFPRVVAFGGGAGLRRTLGGLATALRVLGAPDTREWLTGVRSGPQEPIDPDVACLLPATLDDVSVRMEPGVDGASRRRLSVVGRSRPVPELLQRIVNADVIVVGPGSLYSRILPSLLVGGVAATVSGLTAVRIYVANLTTEPGETDDLTVADCLDVIRQHTRVNLFDYVLLNRAHSDPSAAAMRRVPGGLPMAVGPIGNGELVVVEEDLAECDAQGNASHVPIRLARAILRLSRIAPPRGLIPGPGVVREAESAVRSEPAASAAYERMLTTHTSFWLAVRDPFLRHDLTRDDVRDVVRRGLARTDGSYRLAAELFNLAPTDYERFLTFLWKYGCDVPFRHSA